MNIAGFFDESISNGAGGHRAVVFVSGCLHNCPGCHNPEAQNFNYGETLTEEKKRELIDRIKENSIVKGITLTGGDPLCPQNVEGVLDFVKDVKQEIQQERPNFNVWCYTGYTMEELIDRDEPRLNECLEYIDILVDGKFLIEKKDPTLKHRGSSNQRIIDINAYKAEKEIKQINI